MKQCPAWYYNEFQQIGADFTNEEVVEDYDDRMNRLRDLDAEMETIRRALNLQPHHTLLEFGTGTGELPLRLADHCHEIIAVDISEVMLDTARRKTERNGKKNIRFVQGGFLTYEHQGEPVDAVVSQLALHHLPDFWKWIAVRNIYDCLCPGGRFYLRDVVFVSDIQDYSVYFDRILEGMQKVMDDRLVHNMERHVRQEYSTLDWIMVGLLQRAGFTLLEKEHQHGLFGCYACEKR